MVEPVRLVIWDLDETFWRGTVTEGGMSYRREVHDIVVALSRRGILNSICSKNDEAVVRPILEQHGIWDYFIFPSINWEPKGPRIARLIETVQLRPATVLFIDDNPMNLNEAAYYAPGVQIAAETIIPDILADPLFKGKDDSGLTRLAQYKLLERRKQDETAAVTATGNQLAFLRDSNIRVRFEYDLETHIDRVVELINRTNQLNFIKARLPEDITEARAAARKLFSNFDVQAALVHVTDNYGDYGFCGFYAVRTHGTQRHLFQFAFSCRILGMGVERWLYNHLGRPGITIQGEVLAKLDQTEPVVDWVTIGTGDDQAQGKRDAFLIDSMVVRGGCDLTAVGHYLMNSVRNLTSEFNTTRNHMSIRLDHSAVLRLGAEGVSPEAMKSLRAIGYTESDFDSAIFSLPQGGIAVLSFAVDAFLVTYRHKKLGFRVPFWNPDTATFGNKDMTIPDNAIMERLADKPGPLVAAWEMLTNYVFEGYISAEMFKENLTITLDRLGPGVRVFVLGPNDHFVQRGELTYAERHFEQNVWIKDVLKAYPNAQYVNVRNYIRNESEVLGNVDHFDRSVYYRIYEGLMAMATGTDTGAGSGSDSGALPVAAAAE
jgi:FkbH-like protein